MGEKRKSPQQRYLENVVRVEECACGCGSDVEITKLQTFPSYLKRKKDPDKWYLVGHNAIRGQMPPQLEGYNAIRGQMPPQLEGYNRRTGEEAANWKGGRHQHSGGYVQLTIDGKQILEHRHTMERHLGRKLTSNDLVHHRNGNKTDNRIENLELLDRSSHAKIHNGERHRDSNGRLI